MMRSGESTGAGASPAKENSHTCAILTLENGDSHTSSVRTEKPSPQGFLPNSHTLTEKTEQTYGGEIKGCSTGTRIPDKELQTLSVRMCDESSFPDAGDLQTFLDAIPPDSPIGFDIETTALRPKDGRIRLIQFWYGGKGLVIDVDHLEGGIGNKAANRAAVKSIGALIQDRPLVCFNAQFEWSWFHANGITLTNLHDAKLAHAALQGGSISLKQAAQRYLNEDIDKDQQTSDWNRLELTPQQIDYALKDAELARRLWEVLVPKMEEQEVVDGYYTLLEAVPMVCRMQLNGMRFDLDPHAEEVARCQAIFQEADEQLNQAETPIENWNSPKQIQEWLKEQLSLAVRRRWPRTETKRLSTKADAIGDMLKTTVDGDGIPESVRHILEIYLKRQEVNTILKTFGPSLAEKVQPNGRLYGDFQIAGAVTGRMSSSQPNLQNMPNGAFRDMFVASPGYQIVGADYEQIEVRVGGLLAGDTFVAEQFASGHDFHQATAALMTGKDVAEVTKEERKLAKGITFGMQYGMGDASLAKHLGIPLEAAREQARQWEATFQGIADWRKRSAEQGKATRELRTATNRRIQLPPRPAPSQCFNYPVQGSAADVMYAALAALERRLELFLPEVRPLAVVHDEIVLEVPEEEVDIVKNILESAMVEGFLEIFPDADPKGVVKAKAGRTWGEVK